MQKGYRLLDRSKEVGEIAYRMSATNVPAPADIPGMAEALEMFTGRGGGERTRWSDVNLDDRISVIQRELPIPLVTTLLLMGLVNCYEIGAEVQHATYTAATVQRLDTLGGRKSHLGVIRITASGCVAAAGIAVGAKLGDEDVIDRFKNLVGENARAVVAALEAERRSSSE